MSSCLDRASSFSSGVSPFDRLIAFEVYDGPTTGVAFCRGSDDPVLFRLLAWDEAQVMRVFSLAPLTVDDGVALLTTLSRVDAPRWPEWWVKGPATSEAARRMEETVSRMLSRAGPDAFVVVTKDLLGAYRGALRIAGGAQRQEFERLSNRASPDEEVTDGSFEEWLKFIDDYTASR
jgi:hypothetical protein